jgi:hypothetical protein
MRSILGFIILVISIGLLLSFDNALQTHPSFTISTLQSSKVTQTFQQDNDGLSLPSCVRERLKDSTSYFNRTWTFKPVQSTLPTKADNLSIYALSFAGAKLTRQPFIKNEIEKAGLSATLVTGFDGKNLSTDDINCWISEKGMNDKDLMIPGRGYMSQTIKSLSVLFDIVSRNLPYGMTIEDDKIINTMTYKSLINTVLDEAPEGWHLIQFDECYEGMRPHTWSGCAEHTKSLWRCTQPRCSGNSLYSNEGARMLLSLVPVDTVMDYLLSKPLGLQILWVEPFASWEDKSLFPSVNNAEANRDKKG